MKITNNFASTIIGTVSGRITYNGRTINIPQSSRMELVTCFIRFAYKTPRLLHALNIAYKYEKRYVQIPTKPRAIQGTTSIRHPQYGLWAIFENKNNI